MLTLSPVLADIGLILYSRHVQCVLNFEDNVSEDGGTLVVPYFHRHVAHWARSHEHLFKPLPWLTLATDIEQDLLLYAHRVCMRAGSVLLWDQRLLHGTAPNFSTRCRLAQYLKAGPRSSTYPPSQHGPNARLQRRAHALLRQLQQQLDMVSEAGWHAFGLDAIRPYVPPNNTDSIDK